MTLLLIGRQNCLTYHVLLSWHDLAMQEDARSISDACQDCTPAASDMLHASCTQPGSRIYYLNGFSVLCVQQL